MSSWHSRRTRSPEPAVGPGELTTFSVEGSVDGRAVRAVWDGDSLVLSEILYRRALLTVAVDAAFLEARLVSHRHRSTLDGPAADVALTLIGSCDALTAVEYTQRGRRKNIAF